MGRAPLPKPTGLALAVAKALENAWKASGLTELQLEALTKISDSYMRKRLSTKELPLTVGDVEVLCRELHLGDPGAFIAEVENGSGGEVIDIRPRVGGPSDAGVIDAVSEPDTTAVRAKQAATQPAGSEQDQGVNDGDLDGGSGAPGR